MSPETDLPIRSDAMHAQAATFAGPPPLIEAESAASYEALLTRVCATLEPTDVLEHIWIRDFVDLVWEVFRLRRLKAALMTAAAHEAMTEVLRPLSEAAEWAARDWAKREAPVVKTVEAALAQAGLSMDAVAARTVSVRIGDFERIERMTAAAEARRNAALRELQRHRAGLAGRLHRTVREMELKVTVPAAPARKEGA
jgi:hypothetical protein